MFFNVFDGENWLWMFKFHDCWCNHIISVCSAQTAHKLVLTGLAKVLRVYCPNIYTVVKGFQAKSCSVPFWNLNNCWIDGRCKKTNWSSLPTRLMNSFKTIDLILNLSLFFLCLNEKMNTRSIKKKYCRYTILQKFSYPFLSMINIQIQKGRKEEKYLIKPKAIYKLYLIYHFMKSQRCENFGKRVFDLWLFLANQRGKANKSTCVYVYCNL